MEQTKILAICGIDTGIGKSMVTGLMAGALRKEGMRVTTQKPVQTGCEGRPEDILLHRRLMGAGWSEADEQGLSCPYCFPFPASPHLAARLAGSAIEPETIDRATEALARDHDLLLIEGAGGLLVPLNENLLQLDYLAARGYPLVLVTSPRLGSINHTLLSLEAIRSRDMRLAGLVYNLHGDAPAEIVRDTLVTLKAALARYGLACRIVLLPDTRESTSVNWKVLLDG
ncbi:MAG TPA: ATP-dependent dethiobiotin synthetase BioD [Desulfobulbus sp.]|nr:ATP-dependent dethiobiotin synthetase BioD [Desulfobulbus sp.]